MQGGSFLLEQRERIHLFMVPLLPYLHTQKWFSANLLSCLFKALLQCPTLCLPCIFPPQYTDWPEARRAMQKGNIFYWYPIKCIRDWSIGKYRPQNTKEESVFLCKFLSFTFSKTCPPLCLQLGALWGCQVATKMSNTITSTVPHMPHDGRDCVLHSGHDLLLSGPLSSWWFFLLYIL